MVFRFNKFFNLSNNATFGLALDIFSEELDGVLNGEIPFTFHYQPVVDLQRGVVPASVAGATEQHDEAAAACVRQLTQDFRYDALIKAIDEITGL